MKLKTFVALAGILGSAAVMADTYQAELSLEYTDIENLGNSTLLTGEFYFKPVDTANKPLAEAAFLQKSSSVQAFYGSFDSDFYSANSDATGVGVAYYVPNTMVYVALHAFRSEFDGYTNNDWCTSVGLTPVDGLLVATNYCHDAGYNANLQAKYVTSLGGETALNLEASFTKGDDDIGEDDSYSLAADYYFNHRFSLGATYEEELATTYGVRTRYFFNEQFSLGGAYADSEAWGDTYTLSASVRF